MFDSPSQLQDYYDLSHDILSNETLAQLESQKHPSTTVDGKNPAPVDMVNIPLFTRFLTSQVVQDFFHQQYQQINPNVYDDHFWYLC